MMKNDDIIIVKHGKEYDEESEFLDKYPIAICPECLGSATYIVKSNMPDRVLFNGHMTMLKSLVVKQHLGIDLYLALLH